MEIPTINGLSTDVSDAKELIELCGGTSTLAFEIIQSLYSYKWANFKSKLITYLGEFLKEVETAGKEIKEIDSEIKSYSPKFADYSMLK